MEQGVSFTRLEPGTEDRFVALRRALRVTTFGLNQMILQPGQQGRIHRHEKQEEVFFVLEGTLTLSIEGKETDMGPGELVRVAPDLRRRLLNRGPDRCLFIAIGGAHAHEGRDGIAYEQWDDTEGRPPQEVPLPGDLPASDRRS